MALSSISSYDEYFVEEYVEGHEYTAPIIGDTVNIASRIESTNKDADTRLLISEVAYKEVQNFINVERLI